MRIAMFQSKNAGTMEANLQKSIRAMEEAAAHGADLILFPEVQLTEFFPQYPRDRALQNAGAMTPAQYQVSLDSPVVRSFCDAARENHIMAVPNLYLSPTSGDAVATAKQAEQAKQAKQTDTTAAQTAADAAITPAADDTHDDNAIEKEKPQHVPAGKAFDASLLIGRDGQLIGIQKMVHIAQAPQFYEQDYYLPSDDGFLVFPTEFGRIGIVVCFDRHYPESIRTEALRGADLILIPTANTKAEPSEMFEWEIRVQAFQNSVAIAMCNRVGTEGAMQFSGESLVADANGNLLPLASASQNKQSMTNTNEQVRRPFNEGGNQLPLANASITRPGVADDREQILYADLDMAASARTRAMRPYTTLRRPQDYV